MAACRLIVCEKSGDWAAALREALGTRQPRVVETRSLTACEAELGQSPASLMAIEVTEANLKAVLQFLAKIHEGYRRAAVVAMVAYEASAAANLLREAGALDVVTSVLEVPRVARM